MFQYKYIRVITAAVGVAAIFALFAHAHTSMMEARYLHYPPVSISVSGEGEVDLVPDIAKFHFNVTAEAGDVKTSQEQAAVLMNDILEYLRSEDIAEKDIKSSGYNTYPRYEYTERICTGNGYCPPGERVMVGHETSQSVTVTIREIDDTGKFVSGVGERGATSISGMNLMVEDQKGAESDAREAAIKDAEENARELAKDLGVRLGRMVGFSEGGGNYYPRAYGGDMMESAAVSMDTKSTPEIPVGENTIRSNVNVTYIIR